MSETTGANTGPQTGTDTAASHSASYAAAGVDITAGYRAVDLMAQHVARTHTPGVVSDLGGFGGVFAPGVAGMERPLLVSGTDGVGTKLKLAFLLDIHDTVGIDCVAMCVNDIVCSGAAPMFFLDYIACGKNVPERIASVVAGVAEGCVQAGAALIGGETAEMPGFYAEDEYDLAGFAVGLVDEKDVLDPGSVRPGDAIVGLASSGVHSNGFSLVRKVFDVEGGGLERDVPELSRSLGEALLEPTRIYVRAVRGLLEAGVAVRSVGHITGGGLYENLPRALPEAAAARIEKAALPHQVLFDVIAREGAIPERDMYNTFNMGLGMAIVVPAAEVDRALATLTAAGETAAVVGEVVAADAVSDPAARVELC